MGWEQLGNQGIPASPQSLLSKRSIKLGDQLIIIIIIYSYILPYSFHISFPYPFAERQHFVTRAMAMWPWRSLWTHPEATRCEETITSHGPCVFNVFGRWDDPRDLSYLRCRRCPTIPTERSRSFSKAAKLSNSDSFKNLEAASASFASYCHVAWLDCLGMFGSKCHCFATAFAKNVGRWIVDLVLWSLATGPPIPYPFVDVCGFDSICGGVHIDSYVVLLFEPCACCGLCRQSL